MEILQRTGELLSNLKKPAPFTFMETDNLSSAVTEVNANPIEPPTIVMSSGVRILAQLTDTLHLSRVKITDICIVSPIDSGHTSTPHHVRVQCILPFP